MDFKGITVAILLLFALVFPSVVTAGAKDVENTIMGIDLATTSTWLSVYRNGKMEIIDSVHGNRTTPSWLAYGDAKALSPEEINAHVLGKMKETVESYLGHKVQNAYITIPAYINDTQWQTTKDAATAAGLERVRIFYKPIAAAIANGLEDSSDKNILVYHLGGATFHVSVLYLDSEIFYSSSTGGDTQLGGEDFDRRLMDHMIDIFKNKYGKDMSKDEEAVGKLRRECERAKRELSSQEQVRVEIESLFDGIDFSENLTRATFEELNEDLFRKTMEEVKRVMEEAKLEESEIDELVLIGGSTRIPKIREMLMEFFGRKEPYKGEDSDGVVAYSTVIAEHVYGIDRDNSKKHFGTMLAPFRLGIETAGGVMTPLIEDIIFPFKSTKVFTTYQDNQTTVEIKVFKGQLDLTTTCRELGKLTLSGIPPAPRGVPKMEVTLEADDHGIIKVTAEDKATKKKESITITITEEDKHITREEIRRMMAEIFEDARKEEADKKLGVKIVEEDKESQAKEKELQVERALQVAVVEWLDDHDEL